MDKKEIKVFNAYIEPEDEEYYKKANYRLNDLFKYHNQEIDSDGYVRPWKIYRWYLPALIPSENNIKTITKYCLDEKEIELLEMYKQTKKQLYDLLASINHREEEYKKALYRKLPYKYLFEGEYWECNLSPFGRCLYTLDSSGEPKCIFCGEPEERK